MGWTDWFWGGSGDGKPASAGQDPLQNLDPGLREFLAKESPINYNSSNPPAPVKTPPTIAEAAATAKAERDANSNTESSLPSQSLFKDGRYAHLWATYQPQAEAEAEAKSEAEKIDDALEGFKHRKAQIGRAALENCALEQWDLNECFKNGGVVAKMTMCRTENKSLERCYNMQAKFLKALGYLSQFDRPAEMDERIQMHADTLYHRMLDQEAAIKAAEAEGKPIPTFPPILSYAQAGINAQASVAPKTAETTSNLPIETQRKMAERLKGLSPEEKILEEESMKAELKAGEQLAGRLGSIYEAQEAERRKRKEEGKETIGDKLTSIFNKS